ncbi:MAG: GNAT family N-acetyltransferase [Nocardioidaceae bacterium]
MTLDVRELGSDDWELWRDIRLCALRESPAAFGSTYEREQGFTPDLWQGRLADPEAVSVLALADGSPVGMGAGFQDLPGHLHVVAMWVDPSWRGQQVGHRVLDAVRQWADRHALRLHLDVSTANPTARRSYERYGFVGTDETRPLREDTADQVERMVLPQRSG